MPKIEQERPESLNTSQGADRLSIPERDYRGLKIVQAQSLSLFAFLASENQLSQIIQSYVGENFYTRNADIVEGHVQRLTQVFDEWDGEDREGLFYSLLDVEKLSLEVFSSDTFNSPREIAQELFADGKLDGVMGFVTEEYETFQRDATTYLLQQLCRVKFSNPELRISLHATERFANDDALRERARQNLDQGRESRGLLPYSGDDTETLTRLWNDGVPIKDIAETLGRTPNSVQYHTAKLELPLRRENRVWTEEEDGDLLRLKSEIGLSNEQIADILDRTEKSVHSRLVNAGVVSFTRTLWEDEEFELLQQLLKTHSSYDEVLEILSSQFPRGRKKQDLIAKANFEGLRVTTEFELKREEFEVLLASGLSHREIADRLGIARPTVGKWKRKLDELSKNNNLKLN